MTLNITQVGTLFGNQKAPASANVYDLVRGSKQTVNSSLFASLSVAQAPSLSPTQSNALSRLQNYVNDNITGKDADTLTASIAALQKLMELGNADTGNTDPVFSLLANNRDITGNLPAGSLIDLLF